MTVTCQSIQRTLSRFKYVDDFEHNGTIFKTNVPWIAPKAYLHIVFPPVKSDLLRQRAAELAIPDALMDFYSTCNGALFFSGALSMYGLLPDNYLLNRSDWRCRLPFNIVTETLRWRAELNQRDMFCFGSYSYDRSPVCISRDSGTVTAFAASKLDVVRCSWGNFEAFIAGELERLATFFDEYGRCAVSEELLLPAASVQ